MSVNQLDMTMNVCRNHFKESLDNGKFIFLAECNLPEAEHRAAGAVERIMPLAQMMSSQSDLCGGLAITDRRDAPLSAVEVASFMPEELRGRNLCFVSGDGRDADAVGGQFTMAENSQVLNIVPVTGNAAPFSVRECWSRNYCGSVEQLQMLQQRQTPLFAGSVFNPFHYDGNTALASYSVLMDKIAAGAQYIISQSGWDMLQNQALSWFLLRQKLFIPLLARLTWLTPDKVEKIISGTVPGVRMPQSFRKLIARELLGSKAQFDAAQYRRLELQVAGMRLLGYSGVIISGVDVPGRAAMLASRIRSALQEFQTFEHWLSEYNEHQAYAENIFGVRAYHLFDRLLRRQYPQDEVPEISPPQEVDFSRREYFNYRLKKMFFANSGRERPEKDRILKKILANCRSCRKCTLSDHHYYCVKNCPKQLEYGPCGGVGGDGKCEIGGNECVFVKIMRCERALRANSGLELAR